MPTSSQSVAPAAKQEMSAQAQPRPVEKSVNGALESMVRHWPEYLIEAAGLGTFMISACLFTVLLEYPSSPVRQAVDSAFFRRLLTGIAMGVTAIAIIYSPWGKRSGAHINPAVTFTFFRLGKVQRWDAVFYGASQFVGATAGVLLAAMIAPRRLQSFGAAVQAVRLALSEALSTW